MKKFFLFALMLGLTVSLTACGGAGADGAAGPAGPTGAAGADGADGATGPAGYGAGEFYTFTKDVLPLFTADDVFYTGSKSCTMNGCHPAGGAGAHELDMSTYEGIVEVGADGDFTSVLGQSTAGWNVTNPPNWDSSKMKSRLRDNRMPPDITSAAGRDTDAGKAVAAWVTDGALATNGGDATKVAYNTVVTTLKSDGTTYGLTAAHSAAVTWAAKFDALTIGELFTTANLFAASTTACSAASCHPAGNGGAHELDLSTYAGIVEVGADGDFTSVLGQSIAGVGQAPDWNASKMKNRLRNNRMPDGATLTNLAKRDTPAGRVIEAWIRAGAYEDWGFPCEHADCLAPN